MILRLLSAAMAFLLAAAPAAAERRLDSATIDQYFDWLHAEQGIAPAPAADDASFIRRLSLDVRGVIPTAEEVAAFLADDSPGKRAELIDRFLEDPLRGEHWANYWDTLLVGVLEQPNAPVQQQRVKGPWKEWVAKQFNDNRSYDHFVRRIIIAEGDTGSVPEALPMARWRNAPESMAGTVSRVFLGSQIQCAQCHDHKTVPALTQAKFWEFAAFFAPTRVDFIPAAGGDGMMSMAERIPRIAVTDVGAPAQTRIPDTDPPVMVQPAYLDGSRPRLRDPRRGMTRGELRELQAQVQQLRSSLSDGPSAEDISRIRELARRFGDDRRNALAGLILAHDSDLLAANFANRLWSRLMGMGFLEPVDNWGMGMEPDHPQLLDALAREFIASGWDIRHIERTILNTRAYQRSSVPTESSAQRPDLFAHAMVRPLSPEQMLASLAAATDIERAMASRARNSGQLERMRLDYISQFVFSFGSDEMEWTSAFENSIPRALYLLNDATINAAIAQDGGGPIARAKEAGASAEDIAGALYLSILSRPPTDAERADAAAEIARAASPRAQREAVEDLAWALLASAEFLTIH